MVKAFILAGTLAIIVSRVSVSTTLVAPLEPVQSLAACNVTQPNGKAPTGEPASPSFHGSAGLATMLWPDGTVVFAPHGPGFVLQDGALSMKFPWWRGERGAFTIEGRRIDGDAPPLRARIPKGYGESGFQATALIFPTPGCWEVTGHLGDRSLTFVTRVVKRAL